MAFSFVFSVWRVYEACRTKNQDFGKAVSHLGPFMLYVFGIASWLASPYSVVLEKYLVLFLSTTGIVFGRMAVCGVLFFSFSFGVER